MLRTFRLVFDGIPGALDNIRSINGACSKAGLVRQLMDLSVLGGKYPEALALVNFDPGLLKEARRLSQRLSVLLAECRASSHQQEARDMRDRAYAYLKEAVAQVRKAGKYACWQKKSRLPGYASKYLRQKMKRSRANKRKKAGLLGDSVYKADNMWTISDSLLNYRSAVPANVARDRRRGGAIYRQKRRFVYSGKAG